MRVCSCACASLCEGEAGCSVQCYSCVCVRVHVRICVKGRRAVQYNVIHAYVCVCMCVSV